MDASPDRARSNDLMQSLVDGVEDVLLTLVEEIRERPGVAAALFAGFVGALVGLALAARVARREPPPRRRVAHVAEALFETLDLGRRGRRVGGEVKASSRRVKQQADKRTGGLFSRSLDVRGVADLVPLAMRLLENPIVRAYAVRAISRQLRKRF